MAFAPRALGLQWVDDWLDAVHARCTFRFDMRACSVLKYPCNIASHGTASECLAGKMQHRTVMTGNQKARELTHASRA